MANYSIGRIALHVGCIVKGGKRSFHYAGIARELPSAETIVLCAMLSPLWVGLIAFALR